MLIDPDLAEQHFGSWQGLTYTEIAEKHGDNHLFWLGPPEYRPPGGESFVDLRDRTVKSIDRLTDEHRGRDIVATAHGGTIRAENVNDGLLITIGLPLSAVPAVTQPAAERIPVT